MKATTKDGYEIEVSRKMHGICIRKDGETLTWVLPETILRRCGGC